MKDPFVYDDDAGIYRWKEFRNLLYADGSEGYLLSLFQNLETTGYPVELQHSIKDWPSLYHLSYLRTNLCAAVEELFREDWRVLECGAGMGALTLWMAEKFSSVDALEGNLDRAKVLGLRSRQRKNIRVFAGDIPKMPFPQAKYHLITLVGFLEYLPFFSPDLEPRRACIEMLEKTRDSLEEDGFALIAIENRLGVKYFCGCTEDHTGKWGDGIIGYPRQDSAITFSRTEMEGILKESGFPHIRFYHLFPDYKLPNCIIRENSEAQRLNPHHWIRGMFPDYSGRRDYFAPDPLVLENLVRDGLLNHFSNSFLILAAKSAKVDLDTKWHIKKIWNAPNTKPIFHHEIQLVSASEGYGLERKPIQSGKDFINLGRVEFQIQSEKYLQGQSLIYEAYRTLFREDGYKSLMELVQEVSTRLLKEFGTGGADEEGYPLVQGRTLDFTFWNLLKGSDGEMFFVDRKWKYLAPLPADYVLFRSLFSLFNDLHPFIAEEKASEFVVKNMKNLYPQYGSSRFDANLKRESEFHSHISIEPVQFRDLESGQSRKSIKSYLAYLERDESEKSHRIAGLENNLQEKEADAGNLQGVILSQRAQISALEGGYRDRETRIASLETMVREKDAHIGRVDVILRDKDSHLAGLADAIKSKEGYIESLENILREKEAHLGNLQGAIRNQEAHISALEGGNRARDLQIVSLETMVKEKDAHIGRVDVILRDKDSHLAELEKALKRRDDPLASLEKVLREKEVRIESQEGVIRDQAARLRNQEDLLGELKETLKEKEGLIAVFEKAARDNEAQIRMLESTLQDRDLDLSNLKETIQDNRAFIASLKRILEEKERQVENLQGDLAEQERAAQELQEAVRQGKVQIVSLETMVREKDAHLGRVDVILKDKDSYLAGLADTIKGKDGHIASLENRLREKETHLESLHDAIRGQEERVHHLEGSAAQKMEESENLRASLQEKEEEIARIYQSHGWKALLSYYRVRNRLFPVHSMRGSIARWFFKRFLGAPPAEEKPEGKTANLICHLDSDLSRPFPVGAGNAFFLRGWCFHQREKIEKLSVLVDGVEHPICNFSLTRYDVCEHFQKMGGEQNSLKSGFWTMLPFERIEAPRQICLILRGLLTGGETCEAPLGRLELQPSLERGNDGWVGKALPSDPPLVAICMATYTPPLDYFRDQIDSIRRQTYPNWVCIINDDCSEPELFEEIRKLAGEDPRFKIFRNETNLGFYYNFERCLSRVPRQAAFVALADQDDHWHENKLEALRTQFDPKILLVYSDMNIVDRRGQKIHPTYWTQRRNNFTRLDLLLVANTVTGAASMFRADLLDFILPFPEKIGDAYHDNFIASVALSLGEIRYIDAALYDYRQHDGNIFGHKVLGGNQNPAGFLRGARNGLASLRKIFGNYPQVLLNYQSAYYQGTIRRVLIAQILQLRCRNLPAKKKRIIRRFMNLDRRLRGAIWQAVKIRLLRKRAVTVGNETELWGSLLANWVMKTLGRLNEVGMGRRASRKIQAQWRYQVSLGAQAEKREREERAVPEEIARLEENPASEVVAFIRHMVAPLRLRVDAGERMRVNSVISVIDFKYFFAGYIGMFNLAKMLAEEGYGVRMVIADECKYEPWVWRREIRKYAGLEDFFERVEVAYAYTREEALAVSPRDVFLANSWWTAHVANAARAELGVGRFLYFSQEYEPAFYRMGTCSAMALESYGFPHYAVFSTEILRDFFRQSRLGVYRAGEETGDRDSVAVENALLRFEVDADRMRERSGKKRFLYYARPEEHAARNMFELGVIALSRVIRRGYMNGGEWEFCGIGSVEPVERRVTLGDGVYMRLLPKMSLNEYKEFLPGFDVGMSLMLSPHPSIVPLEMAAAGMWVVTNTFANKTAESLGRISGNLIAVEPTVEGLERGLAEAVGKVGDYEERVRGSRVNWSQDWKDTFNKEKREKIKRFVREIAGHE